MRELALAIRAIWACWHEGAPLRFDGDFYRHTLMTPFFNPGPNPYGPPRLWLAGVGPAMTEVAGEVADGFLVHPVQHGAVPARGDRFLRSSAGSPWRSDARRVRDRVPADDRDRRFRRGDGSRRERAVRRQLAFYGSTPAYRRVLDVHGWGDIQPELNRLSKEGRWEEMGGLIGDELVDTFTVRGRPEEIAPAGAGALRRSHRPDQLQRAVPRRPGALDGGPRAGSRWAHEGAGRDRRRALHAQRRFGAGGRRPFSHRAERRTGRSSTARRSCTEAERRLATDVHRAIPGAVARHPRGAAVPVRRGHRRLGLVADARLQAEAVRADRRVSRRSRDATTGTRSGAERPTCAR